MERARRAGSAAAYAMLLVAACLSVGCNSGSRIARSQAFLTNTPKGMPHSYPAARFEPTIVETGFQAESDQARTSADYADPFGHPELDLDILIAEVLKRNPSIQALVAAWQAAAQRYPQAIALDDPMLGAMLGPASIDSNEVDAGWMVDGSQKVPWPGKRPLRGLIARDQATAALHDIDDARLRVTEAAKIAFFDYFLLDRELEIIADNVRIMREFRSIAQTKYESNLVTQQDVLQAEVELADLERRQIELERMKETAIARINTLLHRAPDGALAAPPRQIPIRDQIPAAAELRRLALDRRPDLASLAAHIRAEETAVELACKEYCPDLEFIARYDAFWQHAERDLRPQVGVNLNLPLQRERRRAAVAEAIARVSKRRAELDQLVDQIHHDVQAAAARVQESRRAVAIYADRILPAAQQNVESAQAGYSAGQVDFLRLVAAQRQLIDYRGKHYQAIADYHRRLAELERNVGGEIIPLDRP